MGELIMFALGGRAVRPAKPLPTPVVPGREPAPTAACSACSADRTTRVREVRAGIELVLCLDAHGCCVRYRRSTTPESYAAALRGEILAVAP
jgi:hypothetical protein